MISIKVTLDKARLSRIRKPNPYKAYVYRGLVKVWKNAIKTFIMGAISKIHVDTGMTAGSFVPLAAVVKLKSLAN